MKYVTSLILALLIVAAFATAITPAKKHKASTWMTKGVKSIKKRVPILDRLRSDAATEEALSDSMLSAGTLQTTTGVNMRSGPCTSYGVRATLPSGTRVTYSGSSPRSGCGYTWYQVSSSYGSGYVASNFLRQVSSGSSPSPTPSWSAPRPQPRPAPSSNWWSSIFTPSPSPAPTPSWSAPRPQPRPTFPAPSTGGCALKRFSHSRLTGSSCVIDVQFEPTMRKLVQFAEQCRVKIYVTSSWRANANVSGAIVTPATRSNHMAGHAIDFNLQSDSGAFCNSSCLRAQNNPTFTCFTNKVKADSSMRWGISFNDPVHIDDGLNIRSSSTWDQRYRATQQARQSGCA